MTDTWVPAPPQPPPGPPPPGLPPANAWSPTTPCASGDSPSIVDGVVITGVPATISAPYAWSITLNDGNAPPNFSVNRNDGSNNLIDQPVQISGANGQITFPNAIFVNGMQADGNLFINGVMQFSALENLQLPGGTAGQVLTATGVAGFLGWASPAIAADAPSNGNLYGRVNGVWASGGVFTSPLYLQGSNMLAIAGPSGAQRSILGGTGTAPSPVVWRWQLVLGDQTPEGVGNAGSNFSLIPFSNTGAALPPALTINRATGAATLQGPTQILAPIGNTPSLGLVKGPSGGVAMIAGQAPNGPPRWQLYLGDYVAELGNNFGSDFRINNYTDAGVAIGTPLLINRASGNVTFGYGVTITGALVGGNAQFTGQLVLSSGPSQFVLSGGAAGDLLTTNGLGGLFWAPPAGAPGGSVPEAPVDGTSYARNDAGWVHLTHTDITDWAATLAPYALLTNVPPASTSPPIMDGAASPGSAANFSRGDHIHPSDTSRMPVSGGIFTGGVQFNVGGIFPAAAQLVVGGGTNGQALITNGSSVLSWAGPYYAASNPSGYQTAAQVAAVLPPASTVVPLIDGVGAVGTSAAYARADHVHPVVYMGDNRIINGDMRIDQRGVASAGGATTNPAYTVDRWMFSGAPGANFGLWARVATVGVPAFPYCLYFGSTSAHAIVATDFCQFTQVIEADMVSDFAWGTPQAQPVTLSFWALSPQAGTYSGALGGASPSRSYPFAFALAANVWTKVVINIPGDTAGTWVMSGNGGGVTVHFDLGSGANYRAPAGAWVNGGLCGANGAVSVIATNGAAISFTGVKLEIGSVATPFNRQSLAKSLSDCQRYYQHLSQVLIWTGYQGAGMGIYNSLTLLNTMRATPTINLINIGNVNNCTGASAVAQDASNFYAFATTLAAGAANYEADFVFAAEL